MQRGFGGTAFEPVERRRDREVTLGPTMLVALGLGLFTLCGVCFVFGYAMGQHASPSPNVPSLTAVTPTLTQTPSTAATSKPAPSQSSFQPKATAEVPATKTSENTQAQNVAPVQPAAKSAPISAPPAQHTPTPTPSAPAPVPTVVHAALPGSTGGSQPAIMEGSGVKPAFSPSTAQPGTWMVQIAAVSHPEDADVLVSALRKKGYAVSVRRDPADALMHVQVGPFPTHNDAVTMRQKLLNDGYNAIVQP